MKNETVAVSRQHLSATFRLSKNCLVKVFVWVRNMTCLLKGVTSWFEHLEKFSLNFSSSSFFFTFISYKHCTKQIDLHQIA